MPSIGAEPLKSLADTDFRGLQETHWQPNCMKVCGLTLYCVCGKRDYFATVFFSLCMRVRASVRMYVCVCVCVRERERERGGWVGEM